MPLVGRHSQVFFVTQLFGDPPRGPPFQVKEAAQFTDDVMQAMAEKLGINVMAPRPPCSGSPFQESVNEQ